MTRELVNKGSTNNVGFALSKSGVFSSNVAYILDRDHYLMTRELVNNRSINTIGFICQNQVSFHRMLPTFLIETFIL